MKLPGIGLRPLDIAIILIVLALTVVSGFFIYGGNRDSVHLEIEAPEGHWVYGLETDRTVSVSGPLGDTTVVIGGGKAKIVESPCANQTCVAAPAISTKGEWNACLPNEIFIRIAGDDAGSDEGLDAIVY